MTAADVIGAARSLLSDTLTPYRWQDTALVGYLCDGVRLLFSRRPDAAAVSAVVTSCPTLPTSAGSETIALRDVFTPALSHYVASRAIAEDNEHAANQQAAQRYMAEFERIIATA